MGQKYIPWMMLFLSIKGLCPVDASFEESLSDLSVRLLKQILPNIKILEGAILTAEEGIALESPVEFDFDSTKFSTQSVKIEVADMANDSPSGRNFVSSENAEQVILEAQKTIDQNCSAAFSISKSSDGVCKKTLIFLFGPWRTLNPEAGVYKTRLRQYFLSFYLQPAEALAGS